MPSNAIEAKLELKVGHKNPVNGQGNMKCRLKYLIKARFLITIMGNIKTKSAINIRGRGESFVLQKKDTL